MTESNSRKSSSSLWSEIAGIELLTPEEEFSIATASHNGDEEARKLLVRHNLRLAAALTLRHSSPNIEKDELLIEATLGLIEAAEAFNPARGFTFASYARWYIMRSLINFLRHQGSTIYIPAKMRQKLSRLKKTEESLRCRLGGRQPTPKEITQAMQISLQELTALNELPNLQTVSLDAPKPDASGEGFQTLKDSLISRKDETIQNADMEMQLKNLLRALTVSEREILELRFGLNGRRKSSLQALSQRFAVPRERIRQVEIAALRNLRALSKSTDLSEFLL